MSPILNSQRCSCFLSLIIIESPRCAHAECNNTIYLMQERAVTISLSSTKVNARSRCSRSSSKTVLQTDDRQRHMLRKHANFASLIDTSCLRVCVTKSLKKKHVACRYDRCTLMLKLGMIYLSSTFSFLESFLNVNVLTFSSKHVGHSSYCT